LRLTALPRGLRRRRVKRTAAARSEGTTLRAVVKEPPRGTVTFLFTDLEGSTNLVRVLGDDYSRVLSDTRRLVREAVEQFGGYEVDCRADEFFIAFARARDAVDAALAAQVAFRSHPWPEGTSVRIRMGLHTGEPVAADDTYYGLDVHRAARICSAGHGGQVLVSRTTHDLLDNGGRDGFEFIDLGEHALAGLPGAQRLYQLGGETLEREFPPLRVAHSQATEPDPVNFPVPDEPPLPAPAVAEEPVRPLRVVLADDSVLLREGVARLLEEAGFDVAAQSGTKEDLLRHVAMHKPDVAITDIRMPPTQTDEGLRAAQEIRERFPGVGVLVLSQYVEPAYALELLSESAEGVGYLLKDRVSDLEEFAGAVRRVGEGGSALDPAVVNQLVGRRRRADPLEELTAREREVLELMAEGRSNDAISKRLFITPRAVEKHVTSIFQKLHLTATPEDHRRVLAVLAFLRA
jgi:DNA-binding NarL/FixJ family response regulator/class 3 adenylate cyclase